MTQEQSLENPLYQEKTMSVTVGGQELVFSTGKIAKQAAGSVTVRVGDTIVFAAAARSEEPKEGIDFLPLTINHQELFSAAGKTPGGFIKRQGRPIESDTLTSRLIDRPLRPLFPKGYHHEIQVTSNCWSFDHVHSPDVLGLCASSAALVLSDIPLLKPVGGVRVGLINNEFVVNPTVAQQEKSELDLLIAGTEDAVLMIEGFCDFLTEDQVIAAIETGHAAIRSICVALGKWREELGAPAKKTDTLRLPPEGLKERLQAQVEAPMTEILKIGQKQEREAKFAELKEATMAKFCPQDVEEPEFEAHDVAAAFKSVTSHLMRKMILDTGVRSDGRSTTDVRPIVIEMSPLPRTHGSTLFTRGETQAMAICTLGSEGMAQRFETMVEEGQKRFYLQYFFPPYSVGEVGRMGPAGRREIGHGHLAERALKTTLPSRDDFPYTIRVESHITESNGSSSMASVCGGCLALMGAGVPIKRPVSGIAMGLILEEDRHVVLSDILGLEDALGDMDFKITGDEAGITAFQMDIKVEGITPKIMRTALEQARDGRVHILKKMLEVCPEPKELSVHAPRIETLRINPSLIAKVIGPGGKMIRSIVEETGVQVDIEDDGLISMTSNDPESMARAKQIIEGITAEVEIGKTYQGKVVSVVAFGAFVEILPGKEGLCHISELDNSRVENINEFIQEGQTIPVKVLDINERGQIKLSRKATIASA